MHHDVHQRVGLGERLLRGDRLGLADVALAVDDLALQVGLVDLVELGDAEGADTGGGEVEQGGAAETTGADDQHLGVLEPLLPGHPDVRDDQVAAVAADLVDGELVSGLDQGWQGHELSSAHLGCDSGVTRRTLAMFPEVRRPLVRVPAFRRPGGPVTTAARRSHAPRSRDRRETAVTVPLSANGYGARETGADHFAPRTAAPGWPNGRGDGAERPTDRPARARRYRRVGCCA